MGLVDWRRSKGEGASGKRGYLGEIKVFDLQWGVVRQREKPWVLYCELPGYTHNHGSRRTWAIADEAEADRIANAILTKWLEATGLKEGTSS